MQEYLTFTESLARKAGRIIAKDFRLGVGHRLKEDLTMVTSADEEINELVIREINKNFPSHSVFGEEASLKKKSSYVWLCDPIDGTVPFAKGIAFCAFSIALAKNGEPVLGVVYDPFNNRLFSGVKGKGSSVNGKRLRVSKVNLVRDATLNLEWWPEAERDLDTAMHNLSKSTEAYVLHFGSIVASSCLVAAGQLEACVFAGTKRKSVDIAAVKVLVEEAGGKVTDLDGNDQKYFFDINGAVISNGIVHDEVVGYVKRFA